MDWIYTPARPLRLGTRPSALAQKMAQECASALQQHFPELSEPGALQIIPISTSGEWRAGDGEKTFAAMGGNKGLFAKELQQALLAGQIDVAVHSLKDLENFSPQGLTLAGYLPREDARDVFLSPFHPSPAHLPAGTSLGTASVRRAAQLLAMRSDIHIVPLRGNVDTRLDKLARGQVPAAVMAAAGLLRLGRKENITRYLSIDEMVPAAGQGAVALEMRNGETELQNILTEVNDAPTALAIAAERSFVKTLNGDCHTPIGAYAALDGQTLTLTGLIASPDGKNIRRDSLRGPAEEGEKMGIELAHKLRQAAGWWPHT